MGRATDQALDALHALLAEGQAESLQRNLERNALPKRIPDPADPTGKAMIENPDWEPLDTKLIQAVRQFLKDNGIDAPASSKRFSGILDELQNLNVDDPAHFPN